MTTAEKDAARLLDAALQATSGTTFISSTLQVFIGDRLKTAQALLATSISLGGRRALVHVTAARNFVEAIEAPRLREHLQAALAALNVTTGLHGLYGLGRGAELPAALNAATQAELEANEKKLMEGVEAREALARQDPPTGGAGRGMGLLVVALAITLAIVLYRQQKA